MTKNCTLFSSFISPKALFETLEPLLTRFDAAAELLSPHAAWHTSSAPSNSDSASFQGPARHVFSTATGDCTSERGNHPGVANTTSAFTDSDTFQVPASSDFAAASISEMQLLWLLSTRTGNCVKIPQNPSTPFMVLGVAQKLLLLLLRLTFASQCTERTPLGKRRKSVSAAAHQQTNTASSPSLTIPSSGTFRSCSIRRTVST